MSYIALLWYIPVIVVYEALQHFFEEIGLLLFSKLFMAMILMLSGRAFQDLVYNILSV